MSIIKLISNDNYIPVNRDLIKIFGLEETLILGELCAQYNYWEKENKLIDDMFYCSSSKLKERTGLSEYQQRKAIESLKDFGVIETELKGCPAIKYFRILPDQIFSFLTTSSKKNKELVTKKLQSSNNLINNKKEKNELLISKDINNSQKVEEIKNLYNSHCTNLPKIAKLTDKRIKAIGSLLKKYSVEEITQVFDIANESDFLMGKNDRGWKADLDFILREDKFINILEGKYGGHRKINRVSSDMGRTANRMTDDQKKQLKEDMENGRAEKY